MKANMILVGLAVAVFLGLYLAFPYTDMGQDAYEANRRNAELYVMAYRYDPDPGYQREVNRLIEKYDLPYSDNGTTDYGLGEYLGEEPQE